MPRGVYERTEKARFNMSRGQKKRARETFSQPPSHRGVTRSVETRKKMSVSKIGELNPNWVGDAVTYKALHLWVQRESSRASEHLCLSCFGPADQWANVSGEYRRDLKDFIPLCQSCHRWFDGGA